MIKRIAVYGKGGIGKSTISSNISAALGYQNKRVLQIGCDPKHDSTLILANKPVEPALEIYFEKEGAITIDDIVFDGRFNTKCIEFGGPEPGIGCAGRGIMKGLELLNQFNYLNNEEFDLILFDTLGDVVCGGFFEPLKSGKTQEMYIVTSGEFNSLFAANNLCKGYVNNCSLNRNTILAGIIGNCRGVRNEERILYEFSKAINVPLIEVIPRNENIEYCSDHAIPIIEAFPESSIGKKFIDLADRIMDDKSDILKPVPLSLDELRELHSSIYRCEVALDNCK